MKISLKKSIQRLAIAACLVFPLSQAFGALPECKTPGACTDKEQAHPFDEQPFTLPEEFAEAWADYRTGWGLVSHLCLALNDLRLFG